MIYLEEFLEDRKPSKKAIKEKLYLKFGCSCCYCGKGISFKEVTLDHFIPISKGGHTVITNLLPSCYTCNFSKSNTEAWYWWKAQTFWNVERALRVISHTKGN